MRKDQRIISRKARMTRIGLADDQPMSGDVTTRMTKVETADDQPASRNERGPDDRDLGGG